eukprot:CAMPEP_0206604344 /NCGR_PEP_ID=MMETSP0325_2-20121206/49259_1 /ASSEMBLY_ACC=CAM_ASM_000347 /TAXON_ID=2866 /ORGANISM="Crypthecodinium cohnii, Strain Seligo" /LENGTH=66 /DNA_ID=CAMNT_0054118669 /DNA_START=49 /DNA_END=246 /DNA_ORIENTATION=+
MGDSTSEIMIVTCFASSHASPSKSGVSACPPLWTPPAEDVHTASTSGDREKAESGVRASYRKCCRG